jgi:hypothetical protein
MPNKRQRLSQKESTPIDSSNMSLSDSFPLSDIVNNNINMADVLRILQNKEVQGVIAKVIIENKEVQEAIANAIISHKRKITDVGDYNEDEDDSNNDNKDDNDKDNNDDDEDDNDSDVNHYNRGIFIRRKKSRPINTNPVTSQEVFKYSKRP